MSDPREIAKIVSTNLNVNNGMLFEDEGALAGAEDDDAEELRSGVLVLSGREQNQAWQIIERIQEVARDPGFHQLPMLAKWAEGLSTIYSRAYTRAEQLGHTKPMG